MFLLINVFVVIGKILLAYITILLTGLAKLRRVIV